eukprot:TRINITY_DN1145_c0_g1_i2.p1 TRINITY_DN1145_c0_g1~~TRINITY_DN1145_c0_g1_i2.p1  ORF type:complete len:266 (+),score=54.06 TRINITY_DN1145_c0_g1_i2:97-894(+)
MTMRLQHDWNAALREQKSEIWVNSGQAYGTIHCSARSDANGKRVVDFDANEGFKVEAYDQEHLRWMQISHNGQTQTFYSQNQVLNAIHGKGPVNCVDLSPLGELGVSCGNDGNLKVWEAASGNIMRNLVGHIGDLYTCQFFPSGKVVISGGSDMRLKIWSVEEGTCAAELKGHRARILGTRMIGRGRNLISHSLDGTVKLWETGSQSVVRNLLELNQPINDASIVSCSSLSSASIPPNPLEFGTDGQLVLVASEDKKISRSRYAI